MSAPCRYCNSGRYLRLLGEHYQVSNEGMLRMGACTAPEVVAPKQERPWSERLAEWVERVNRDCHKRMPLPTTEDVPRPFNETDREEEP